MNSGMRESIHSFVEVGGKLLAECGGMMYLCKEIIGTDGNAYPMAGVLPQSATMENMKADRKLAIAARVPSSPMTSSVARGVTPLLADAKAFEKHTKKVTAPVASGAQAAPEEDEDDGF